MDAIICKLSIAMCGVRAIAPISMDAMVCLTPFWNNCLMEFIHANLKHCLAIAILFSRFCDIGSTYLVSPRLHLEANPIMKKLGWKFALLTPLACLIPYLSVEVAVAVLPAFLLVSASNFSKVWIVRTLGEKEQIRRTKALLAQANPRLLSLSIWAPSALMAFAGLVLILGGIHDAFAFWYGTGIIAYAFVIGLFGESYFARLRREMAEESAPPQSPSPTPEKASS